MLVQNILRHLHYHIAHGVGNILTHENLTALRVYYLALHIHNVVVFQDVGTGIEIAFFYSLLRLFYLISHHAVL